MADDTGSSKHGGYVFYHYTPSLPAAIIFVVLFFATTAFHSWQLFRRRTWYMLALLIGGIFEIIGYAARGVSHNDKEKLGPFIIQSVLLLVAPALFAASVYMILGRIILLVDGEQFALIRRKWLTKIFVCGDVLSFLIQSSGAGIMATGNASSSKNGSNIIVGGLFVQIIFFGFFVIVALLFHKRALPNRQHLAVPWQKHLFALYGVSVLILVRSIFRVVEYVMGNDSYLMGHEAFLYVFDAVLMLGVMVWMNVVHPGEIISLMKQDQLPVSSSYEFDETVTTTEVRGGGSKRSSGHR